jgi:Flp pilus assembly protein TadD
VRIRHFGTGAYCWALAVWVVAAVGCQHNRPPLASLSAPAPAEEKAPVLKACQAADLKVALGRTLEKRGNQGQAEAVFREALKQDPNRGDACVRLAVLCDRQGKWAEAAEFYRRAHDLDGDSSALCVNQGYSFYLQGRWAEAETSLRQAIVLDPANPRARNNLGLTLAHTGRAEEALTEFRRAGCKEAEAQTNLALALAEEGSWTEARAHYEQALTADPGLAPAQKGLQGLDALLARTAQPANVVARKDVRSPP